MDLGLLSDTRSFGTTFHEGRHDLTDYRIDCGQDRDFDILQRMIFVFPFVFFERIKTSTRGNIQKGVSVW